MIPEYVPVGADCNLDFRTYHRANKSARDIENWQASWAKLTSGGIAIDHMATPAIPPARITRPILRSDDDALAGVSAFFVTS